MHVYPIIKNLASKSDILTDFPRLHCFLISPFSKMAIHPTHTALFSKKWARLVYMAGSFSVFISAVIFSTSLILRLNDPIKIKRYLIFKKNITLLILVSKQIK